MYIDQLLFGFYSTAHLKWTSQTFILVMIRWRIVSQENIARKAKKNTKRLQKRHPLRQKNT